jgi:hypothetical protein
VALVTQHRNGTEAVMHSGRAGIHDDDDDNDAKIG